MAAVTRSAQVRLRLSGLRRWIAVPQRGQSRPGVGDPRAHDLVALLAGQQGGARSGLQHVGAGLRAEAPPDGVRVEPGVGRGHEQHRADERGQSYAQVDRGEILELHIATITPSR